MADFFAKHFVDAQKLFKPERVHSYEFCLETFLLEDQCAHDLEHLYGYVFEINTLSSYIFVETKLKRFIYKKAGGN